MPRPMLAAFLALALAFAGLPLLSVLLFRDSGAVGATGDALAFTAPVDGSLAGQPIAPVAFGLDEHRCSFAGDPTEPAT